MVAAIDNVGRVLDRFVDGVILDFREWLVRETDLGRRFIAETRDDLLRNAK